MSKFIDLTGMVFADGNIEVIKNIPNNKNKSKWECKCICGNIFIADGYSLRTGITKSCGCKKIFKNFIDLTGMKVNELTVIERDEDYISPKGKRTPKWKCQCSCGNIVSVRGSALKDKTIKSCGCLITNHNSYVLTGEYGVGYTLKGEYFFFDLEDYDTIKDYTWHIKNNGYVASSQGYLHRLLMNFPKNRIVDHINHKKYDNRKQNLRIVNASQNCMNVDIKKNNKSGYKGVYYSKKENKWIANISIEGKIKRLGCYEDIEDAIKVRKEAEEKYYGEYSYDNSMKGEANYE